MAMSVGSGDDGEESVMSEINTTPLVDIMLVLLIIFLITSPVVLKTIKVQLPAEENQAVKTTPEDINISVDKEGGIYINQRSMTTNELLEELKKEAVKVPQPEVHVRGDAEVPYQFIGKVILTSQRAGIQKVGFITEPPDKM